LLLGSKVKIGLVQASHDLDGDKSVQEHKEYATDKHLRFIEEAVSKGVKIICFQELFLSPYFCVEENPKWFGLAELIPEGPTTKLFQEIAKKNNIVIVVPMFEKRQDGVYYNTAAVIDADGSYLGKYRKQHIPCVFHGENPTGLNEKYYFTPGDLGYPVFNTAYGKVGVYICYDRHFPEGARLLGINGAEIIFNPSATVAGLSEHLWKIEQPAHAVANGYYVGAINRVGWERPWVSDEYYGQSYLADPKGQIVAQGSRDKDELIIGEVDRNIIQEVRTLWGFYENRRPDSYLTITKS
jgi:beta-ureidopropionase